MTATGAAALPAAAGAKLIEPISVTTSVDVPANESRHVTLRCPARAVALNAGVTAGLDIADSVPRPTARGWDIAFTAGAKARRAAAVLRCVRMRLPQGVTGVSLAVETRIEPVLDVPAGGTQSVKLSCSHGFSPTGWGLDRGGTALRIRTALPARHGWRFTVANTGATTATGTVYARCLERKQHAETGQRHSFATRSTRARTCRSSEFSVATGISMPSAGFVTGTGPSGQRGGAWHVANGSAGQTSLVCLSTTTQFR